MLHYLDLRDLGSIFFFLGILLAVSSLQSAGILNSLADAVTICLGGLYLALRLMKNNNTVLEEWNWKFFFILLLIFITQNLFVEIFLYHDQLSVGKSLSWAPLSPLGTNFNPILFTLRGRTVFLQSQIPWIIMTPIFYGYLIYYLNKNK